MHVPFLCIMQSPPPRRLHVGSASACDALGDGGRWLADEGLEFAATVERRERVDMLGAATTAMYPRIFEA